MPIRKAAGKTRAALAEAGPAAPKADEQLTRKRKAEAVGALDAQTPVTTISQTKEAKPSSKKSPAPSKSKGGPLKEGDTLPSLKLVREDGEEDLTKDKGAVIFLYPRANTGGCTKQANGFKDNYATLQAAGFDVYGLSFDKPKAQSSWKAKYTLPYHLLTDESGEFIKALGALKPPRGVTRSHVVVQRGGKIASSKIQISPGDSFAQAVKTVAALAKE